MPDYTHFTKECRHPPAPSTTTPLGASCHCYGEEPKHTSCARRVAPGSASHYKVVKLHSALFIVELTKTLFQDQNTYR